MNRFLAPLSLILALGPLAAPGQAPIAARIRDALPAEGLVRASVARVPDQAALDAHYYLADESVLELDGKAEGVFARYRAGGGEALVLAIGYPDEAAAERVYGRFGRDFFGERFDPKAARYLDEIETGDFAGSFRARSLVIFVLEAPDRKSCDALLRRIEKKAQELNKEVL
ncbi:MAG TPA: hypothetical protein VLJ16_07895 [Acidobacteriota bacterium]|nr:hypothetical protein [Acidobacteriota bacterium]